MTVTQHHSPGFADQTPGTAGLRRPQAHALQAHYLENFVQALCELLPCPGPVLIGGDGRAGNAEAIRRSLEVLTGNGWQELLRVPDDLITTPAASLIAARERCVLTLMFTASHNPPGDFGLKVLLDGGAQAGPEFCARLGALASQPRAYYRSAARLVPTGRVLDPIGIHLDRLEEEFDFDRIRDWLRHGHRLLYDALHGATGPSARALFGQRLGLADQQLLRTSPRSDFGGQAPDPNLATMHDLIARMHEASAPDLGAACDGDGDRNFLHARACFISPGDSLAVLADRLPLCPGYRDGLRGVARSFPTSRAVDRVARARGLDLHVTPSGWRHFAPLVASGAIDLCGEEAFGTSGHHLLEKDGLWAILAWLDIMAATGLDAAALLRDHWTRFGRDLYGRHDYENLDPQTLTAGLDALRARLPRLPGSYGTWTLTEASEFRHAAAPGSSHGFALEFGQEARIVVRQSGTASSAPTLRIYLERQVAPDTSPAALEPLAGLAAELLDLPRWLGRDQPDVIT